MSDREIHLHIHIPPDEPDPRIDQILSALGVVQAQGAEMALDLTNLQTEITETQDAQQSVILLVQNLAAEIAAASGDQARVDALAAQLSDATDALAAAVVANTPATPEPTPSPEPTPEPVPEPDPNA